MRFSVECGIPQGLGLLLRTKDATTWHGYHLEEPYALIGTAEDCNVRLSDESIAPFHAYLQMLDDRLFVCDLTESRGVLLDDYPVTAEWVDRSAEIQVGRYELRLEAVDAHQPAETDEDGNPQCDVRQSPSDAVPKNDLILSMRNGGSGLHQVRSSRDISLVGRSQACKFRLGSTTLANFHCSLIRTPDSVWVVDLGSRSGTFLNGERIKQARVTSGSRIQVGRFRVDIDLQADSESDGLVTEARSSALIPVAASRPSAKHGLLGQQEGYSEELIRDLVADVANSHQAAFDQARRMLMELIASQERMSAHQMESLKDQNAQLLEVIRMLTASREPQQIVVNIPEQTAVAPTQLPAPADENQVSSPLPPPESATIEPEGPAGPPLPDADPEIHDAWVRGQLHVISENLKKEQERGVKKLLRGLMPGQSDDALR